MMLTKKLKKQSKSELKKKKKEVVRDSTKPNAK